MSLVDEDGTIHDSENVPVVDLSGSGICLAFPHAVEPETKAVLELNGIPGVGIIDVMCRIVRCSPVERSDESIVYHVGAAFLHLPRSTVNKLVRYLFSVQRANIAKGFKE